jgi:hypothetical protein
MYPLTASPFCRPSPISRVTRGKFAPAAVFFAIAGRDAMVYCKFQKFCTFLPFISHSPGHFFYMVALNYTVYTKTKVQNQI